MSKSIVFSGAGDRRMSAFHLSSGTGWSGFCRWVEELPGTWPVLRAICGKGEVGDTLELRNELAEALDLHPPEDGDTAAVAEALWKNIGVGDSQESASVVG